MQIKPKTPPAQLTAPSAADDPPLRSAVRLAPLFQEATQQPPHEPRHQPDSMAAAPRPLPRPPGRLDAKPAADPALHEMRIASLDRGLLWNGAPPSASTAAACSAPATLAQPAGAAVAAPRASAYQKPYADDHTMQRVRDEADLKRRRTAAAAAAAAQLVSKIAAAVATASADELHNLGCVSNAAIAAAIIAASAASAMFFHLSSTDSAKATDNNASHHFASEALTFDPLGRGMGQPPPPPYGLDYTPLAGLLFTGSIEAGERASSALSRMQTLPTHPSPQWSKVAAPEPQPASDASLAPLPPQQGRSASPATSVNSDKENVIPLKPVTPAGASGEAPLHAGVMRAGLSDRAAHGATTPGARASGPTLPPRSDRRGLQAAVLGWQVRHAPQICGLVPCFKCVFCHRFLVET